MSRRERYIPPADDELRRLEEEHIAKQKLAESRKGLIAKALRMPREVREMDERATVAKGHDRTISNR